MIRDPFLRGVMHTLGVLGLAVVVSVWWIS